MAKVKIPTKSWLDTDRTIKCIDSCTCRHNCNTYAIKETFHTDTQGEWDTITFCDYRKCGWILNQESK